MNAIERIRVRTGLTKPQFLDLLGAKRGRVTLFTAPDAEIDATFLNKATEINSVFEDWYSRVDRGIREIGDAVVTPQVAANILGISEFHLVQLRVRSMVDAIQVTPRRWGYNQAGLRELLERNSNWAGVTELQKRGPLANSFLSWYKRAMRGGVVTREGVYA